MDGTEQNWAFIRAQFPEGWRELATMMHVIGPRRAYLNAKVDDIEQILRLELHRVGLEASLQTTTSTVAAARKANDANGASNASLVELSPPALHKWERKLGPYLAELTSRMTDANVQFAASRWNGYEVMLADGTTVMRPGAKGLTARILYAMRLADMTLTKVIETDEHGSESLRAFDPRPEQLWIVDRGYANPEEIDWVDMGGAAVIVRLNRGALPLYDAEGRRFDVMDHVRSLQEPEAMAEWPVWVHPTGRSPICGRLCAVRLPDLQAEQARQRLRREYGAGVSAEALEAAAWVIVFTTVPSERLTTQQILALYRLRWQMELEIRRDKSIGGMDKLPNFLPETIATWLYAKLLLQQIARKIVSPAVAFPPSAVAALAVPVRGARDAARPRAARRRRDVARHAARLSGDARRAASPGAA